MIEIGFGDIGHQQMVDGLHPDAELRLRVLGDTATAIPELTKLCRDAHRKGCAALPIASRAAPPTSQSRHDALFTQWARERASDWDASPDHAAAARA